MTTLILFMSHDQKECKNVVLYKNEQLQNIFCQQIVKKV